MNKQTEWLRAKAAEYWGMQNIVMEENTELGQAAGYAGYTYAHIANMKTKDDKENYLNLLWNSFIYSSQSKIGELIDMFLDDKYWWGICEGEPDIESYRFKPDFRVFQ